jgi:large subunit ribosomal protein L4
MKIQVKTLENKSSGELELSDAVFGLPTRKDILHRMVEWQRAKKQAGTHKTKGESEVSGTGKKPFKQKGTGNARKGSLRSPQDRGGATIFGPVVRSHAYALPKKFRKLALKTALSSKQAAGKLVVLEEATIKDGKTKTLISNFEKLGFKNALIIDGAEVNESFAKAARNIKHIDVLPSVGANVYDILRHDTLVLTKGAVKALEERLA